VLPEPDPLLLPEPLPLVLPEPEPLELPDPLELEPPVLPEPVLPDPVLLPDPLELPELLDPLAPEPLESPDPLVLLAEPEVPTLLSELPPPQAVSAQANAAMSTPLRTNDVFITSPSSSGQHRLCPPLKLANRVQSTCHSEHKCGRTRGAPVAKRRPFKQNTKNFRMKLSRSTNAKRMSLLFPRQRDRARQVTKVVRSKPEFATRDTNAANPTSRSVTLNTPRSLNGDSRELSGHLETTLSLHTRQPLQRRLRRPGNPT